MYARWFMINYQLLWSFCNLIEDKILKGIRISGIQFICHLWILLLTYGEMDVWLKCFQKRTIGFQRTAGWDFCEILLLNRGGSNTAAIVLSKGWSELMRHVLWKNNDCGIEEYKHILHLINLRYERQGIVLKPAFWEKRQGNFNMLSGRRSGR